jgi:hypothetical protein
MKIKKVLHWLAFLIFLYIFGYAGLFKIMKIPEMMTGMQSMGFGETATLLIGWAEAIGVAGLITGIFYPRIKPLAVLWLWPFAIGALTTHFSYHHGINDYYQALLASMLPLIILATDRHFKVTVSKYAGEPE